MKRRMSLLVALLLITATGVIAAPKLKHQNVKGTVTRIEGQIAYVRVSPTRIVTVQLGPQSYWEYRGCSLAPGQVIAVSAWNDPDDDNFFFAGSISGSGFSVTLTNDTGFPLWVTEETYHSGWYPTRDVYVTYYRPTYRFVPPGHAKGAPPGHVKSAPPGHVKSTPSAPSKQKRSDPRAERGGPRGHR